MKETTKPSECDCEPKKQSFDKAEYLSNCVFCALLDNCDCMICKALRELDKAGLA